MTGRLHTKIKTAGTLGKWDFFSTLQTFYMLSCYFLNLKIHTLKLNSDFHPLLICTSTQ